GSYGSETSLEKLKLGMKERIHYFINFSHQNGIAAEAYTAFDSDPVQELVKLSDEIAEKYLNCVFFSASLISKQYNWFHRRLHSDIPVTLQHHLHLKGRQMVILPVKLERDPPTEIA